MYKLPTDLNLDKLKDGIVTIACNDAGATNLIIEWLKYMPEVNFKTHLDGPASNLWSKEFPKSTNYNLQDALSGSNMLLSGTGWSSSLEHEARERAKESNIYSVAVIDHWVNYKERFIRNGFTVLPDEIWVVDKFGYELALSTFPETKISLLPNYYLINQVNLIRSLESTFSSEQATNILYALEPIRSNWAKGNKEPGEFQALDYFIENIKKINSGKVNLRLRPHPSDEDGKYLGWTLKHKSNFKIDFSKKNSLHEDIAWSDIIVGYQTYVLVLGLHSGKRIISSLPPNAPQSLLPYPEIEELREIK